MKDVVVLQGLIALVGKPRGFRHVVLSSPLTTSSGHQHGEGHTHGTSQHQAVLWVRESLAPRGLDSAPFPTISEEDHRFREGYRGLILDGWDVMLPGAGGKARSKLAGYPLLGGKQARGKPSIVTVTPGQPAAPEVTSNAFFAGGKLGFASPSANCLRKEDVVYKQEKGRRISDRLRLTIPRKAAVAALLFIHRGSLDVHALVFESRIGQGALTLENSAVEGGDSVFDHFEHLYDLLAKPPRRRERPRFANPCKEQIGGRVTCLGCLVNE